METLLWLPMEASLPLDLRPLYKDNLRLWWIGSRGFAPGSLEVTAVLFRSFVPGLVFHDHVGMEPCIRSSFRAYTASLNTLCQPQKLLRRRWNCFVTESSKGHFTILSSRLFKDNGEPGKTSEFYECGPFATFHLLWSHFLEHKQCCVEYCVSGQDFP